MAFKNLEQRYTENVEKLYRGATLKFDNGRASTGANDDPLITRRIGKGYWLRSEGRMLPIASAIADVKRLTLFTFSTRGVLFLAKQQLLQTGNTFEQTRLINPVFAIGNAVPFLHIRRHLRPIRSLLGKTDTSYTNVKKLGQLQKSTYDGFTQNAGGGIVQSLKKLAGPITSTISAFTAKKNIGEELGYDEAGWAQTRPELGKTPADYFIPKLLLPVDLPVLSSIALGARSPGAPTVLPGNAAAGRVGFLFGGSVYTTQFPLGRQKYGAMGLRWDGTYKTYLENRPAPGGPPEHRNPKPYDPTNPGNTGGDDATSSPPSVSNSGELTTKYDDGSHKSIIEEQRVEYQKRMAPATGDRFLAYFESRAPAIISIDGGTNARDLATAARIGDGGRTKKLSYIKDPSNRLDGNNQTLKPYKKIESSFDDPIDVKFAMGNDTPVRFRAYIKNLTQTVSPQYKDYQYVGRIEKFINYVSVQRTISFALGIIAFSEEEIDAVWTRINYLTGMVYPYGWTRGIFQPNIIFVTIGNVYYDQPGYVTSLTTNFNDLTETWDIDREVPIAATMNMQFTLIEKRATTAASPFYGITEDLTDQFGSSETDSPPTAGETQTVLVEVRDSSVTTQRAVQELRGIPVPRPPIPRLNTTVPILPSNTFLRGTTLNNTSTIG